MVTSVADMDDVPVILQAVCQLAPTGAIHGIYFSAGSSGHRRRRVLAPTRNAERATADA